MPRVATPSGIVFQTIQILSQPHAVPASGLSIKDSVPKDYLRWLAAALSASTVAVYLYGRAGALVDAARLGIAVPGIPNTGDLRGTDLQVLMLTPETKGRVLVSELRDPARSESDPISVIGYLVIYRLTGVSDTEAQDMNELSFYLGGEIRRRQTIIATRRAERARRNIEAVARNEERPGTRIAAVMRHLQNGAGASYVGFGVVHTGAFRLLYVRRPHDQGNAKYVAHEPQFALPSTFVDLCSSRAVTRLESNIDRATAGRILGLRPHQGADLRYFVAAAAEDGEAMAAFILASPIRASEYEDPQLLALASFALDRVNSDIQGLYATMNNRMIVNPVFRGRHSDIEPKEVFVLMPFREPWSDQIWQKLVKPICEKQGFIARRADDFYGADIMEDIWRGICRARIVIADITNRNANVFYELGIAHTLGKDVVLITQRLDDLPVDLHRYRCITYENNIGGYAPFELALANTLRELSRI